MEAAQVVVQAVHSIWGEWSEGLQTFPGERPEMQRAFRDCLSERLPAGLAAKKPAGWSGRRGGGLSARYSAWRAYDIGVFPDSDWPMALIELAYSDTNVPHALHNGELKLLGNCNGVGESSGGSYWVQRGLTPEGVTIVERRLQSIPVRALFFVGSSPVLDRPQRAMWWPTPKIDCFWSALLAPEKETTLRRVFQRLAQAGLHCWFYSLCGEESLQYLPPPSSGAI
jgi:hypothetical protein